MRFLRLVERISKGLGGASAVVVGKSDGSCDEEWGAYVAEHGLDVTDVGFQENPYRYMAACRVVLMPSLWEGFGLTAVEAMLLGIPVLSTDVGGLVDVQEGTGNICDTDDDFVRRAELLLTDGAAWRENSALVRGLVRRFTDVDSYVDRIEELYGGRSL